LTVAIRQPTVKQNRGIPCSNSPKRLDQFGRPAPIPIVKKADIGTLVGTAHPVLKTSQSPRDSIRHAKKLQDKTSGERNTTLEEKKSAIQSEAALRPAAIRNMGPRKIFKISLAVQREVVTLRAAWGQVGICGDKWIKGPVSVKSSRIRPVDDNTGNVG
jgi:hypothetical protein